MADAERNTLERYELLDRVAVGGMAEVFRAKAFGAHGFEKTLAIKRILPDLARDPEFEERFIAEAKLAVKLAHANIVQVLDFGRAAGTLFIAMEFVDGLDLAALLKWFRKRDELLPIQAGFHISCEIARGLAFAHRHGVVHRDVSPSNVLLSRAGEVKIADFGIAQAEAEIRQTRKGERRIMGKWRYMSPEQTRAQKLSTVSDVFSAASVIHEILTGHKLFPGDEAEDIIKNIHGMDIPAASTVRRGLPLELDDILAGALVRDPNQRTPKASQLLKALIEVSYKSSIVATAFDVSEAVERVMDDLFVAESATQGLDDLIRAQLGEKAVRPPTVRKTAVGELLEQESAEEPVDPLDVTATAGTLVRRGVDPDGVTLWELDDNTMAAGPVAMRGKKLTGPHPALYDDAQPAVEDLEDKRPRVRQSGSRPVRRWLGPIAAALALGVFGGGIWYAAKLTSDDKEPPPRLQQVEPQLAKTATFMLRSTPPGASVSVNGILLTEVTPTKTTVEPDKPNELVFHLKGFVDYSQSGISLPAGGTMQVAPIMVAVQAGLTVKTTPSDASVYLDGKFLGKTPLDLRNLRPGADRALKIEKADFRTISRVISLKEGPPLAFDDRLVSTIQYAMVTITIEKGPNGGWAKISHKGKALGTTPRRVRLPVGRQRVKLFNPQTKATRTVTIVVVAGDNKLKKFKL